jgi:hypothetical protein
MAKLITDHDMREFVTRALDGREAEYDVVEIVDHLQCVVGTVDLRFVEADAFWRIVEQHAITPGQS